MILRNNFFDRDTQIVAKELLGKVLRVKYKQIWLSAMIIETESYYIDDKASHSYRGYTQKRKALFMAPGTIYMYYSRAGDSINISCKGEGNAVLIKSGYPYVDTISSAINLKIMQKLNPVKNSNRVRPIEKLCSGQVLLCRSLGLTVKEWDQKKFNSQLFYIDDIRYFPNKIIQTTRLGITKGQDEHLMYRFIDHDKATYCSNNPLKKSYKYKIVK